MTHPGARRARPFRNALLAAVVLAAPSAGGAFAAPPIETAQAASASAAVATVDGLQQTLLAVMQSAQTLGPRGRAERLAPVLVQAFDLGLMIRLATTRYWAQSTPLQQQSLTEAFTRFSIATYADQFDGFSGERFEILGERPGPRGTTLVETRIVRPKDEPVRIVYVLNADGREARIVDVIVDSGISELARRISEYNAVLSTAGVEGLVAALHRKANELVR